MELVPLHVSNSQMVVARCPLPFGLERIPCVNASVRPRKVGGRDGLSPNAARTTCHINLRKWKLFGIGLQVLTGGVTPPSVRSSQRYPLCSLIRKELRLAYRKDDASTSRYAKSVYICFIYGCLGWELFWKVFIASDVAAIGEKFLRFNMNK